MEEVWKDINLASLNDHPSRSINSTSTACVFPSMVIQDFLDSSAFNKGSSKRGSSEEPSLAEETNFYGSSSIPPPSTILSLDPRTNFQCIRNGHPVRPNPPPNGHSGGSALFSRTVTASALCCRKKRGWDQEAAGESEDRNFKRLMKNRESAARSRARRQAYTSELELEVAHLVKENAKLARSLEEKFYRAPSQLPKKRALFRTFTAPF